MINLEPIQNLDDLKNYALRKLGRGTCIIEVTPDQLTDCVQDALMKFCKYHFDAWKESAYILEVENNKTEYTLDSSILNVLKIIFHYNMSIIDPNINVSYELWMEKSKVGFIDLTNLELFRHGIQQLQESLENFTEFRFNYSTHKIQFYNINPYYNKICLQVLKINDYTENPGMLNNDWLKQYLIALIGIQWGTNITKYINAPFPGGANLNAQDILERYTQLKDKLEMELDEKYQTPIGPLFA